MPSGRFAANGAWLAVQVMAHNLARWTARIGLGEQIVTTKTLRRRVFALAGRLTRSARRLTLHLPQRCPWETQFSRALTRLRAIRTPNLTATRPPVPPTSPPTRASPVRERSCRSPIPPSRSPHPLRPPSASPKAPADRRQPPVYPNSSPDHPRLLLPLPLPVSSPRPSLSIGGFGFRQASRHDTFLTWGSGIWRR